MRLLYIVVTFVLYGLSGAAKLGSQYLPPAYADFASGHASPQRTPNRPASPSPHLAPRHTGHSNFYAAHAAHVKAAAVHIPILRQEYHSDGHGNYNFGFESGNGIRRNEVGQFNGGWPRGAQSVSGSYSYTGDDGHVYTVNYRADGNGFQATGDHLPTPPPVPREIQQSLARHHGRGAPKSSSASETASYGGPRSVARPPSPSARYLPPQN